MIFAVQANGQGEIEDYARKMFSQYREMNVTTWIIGEPQDVPGWNIPSHIMKVWSVREPIQPMTPIDFNGMLDTLLLRVIKGAIHQAKSQPFVVAPPQEKEND